MNANLLAAQSDVIGESFNIGGGGRISVMELISLIKDAVGFDVQVKNTGMQKGDVRDTYADVTKAKKMIGYTPQVRMEDGINKYKDSICKK